MNKTCKLLLKSFYEDEWDLVSWGANIWKRKKDGVQLWGSNGPLFFTGYENNLRIPIWIRPIMAFHIRRGQNMLATRKLLGSES